MDTVRFTVPGKPQGKGRAKTYHNKHTGFTTTVTPDKTVLYENFIKDRYLQQAGGKFFERGVPVHIGIVARFLPPKSTSKKKQAQMLNGEILPLKKPDNDNVVKAVCDALNGIAYHDDSQVVSIHIVKVYSAMEGIDVTVGEYAG